MEGLMGEKSKYIIIALVLVALVSFGINIHTQGLKKAVERERDALNVENASLNKKIEETQQKVNALQVNLDNISQEKKDLENQRDELKRQFDSITSQKNELVEKLKVEQAKKEEKKENISSLSEDSYWGGILKTKMNLEMELEKLRGELKSTQIDIEALQREKSASEMEIKNLAHEKKTLEQQMQYNQKALDSLTAELVREKNAKRDFQDNSRFLKNENIILKQQLRALSGYKINLEKKVAQLQEEKIKLERNFNDMGSLLEDKYSQMGELKEKIDNIRIGGDTAQVQAKPPQKESIELPPIVVHSQSDISGQQNLEALAALNGKVLAINKENNFAIIDLGTESGVKIGQAFKVYHEGTAVASIEVIEARQDISACDIKKESTPIKIGDIVK